MSTPRKHKQPGKGQGQQSFSGRRKGRGKDGGEGGFAVGANELPVSKAPQKKDAISMKAKTQGAVSRSALTEDELVEGQRKETERNRKFSNEHFYFAANGELQELLGRAKRGDAGAAALLLDCLSRNVLKFQKLCASDLKLAANIVRPGESWPLLHTDLEMRKGYLAVPASHLLRKLKVVKQGRTFDADTIATSVALRLYSWMDYYRKLKELASDYGGTIHAFRKLPPLSPSTVADWWRAAEPYFLEQWGSEFQNHKDFSGWNSAAYPEEAHLALSHKRADIKRRIVQGFVTIAKSLPVVL